MPAVLQLQRALMDALPALLPVAEPQNMHEAQKVQKDQSDQSAGTGGGGNMQDVQSAPSAGKAGGDARGLPVAEAPWPMVDAVLSFCSQAQASAAIAAVLLQRPTPPVLVRTSAD